MQSQDCRNARLAYGIFLSGRASRTISCQAPARSRKKERVGSFSNSVDLNNLNSINNVLGFTTPVGDAFTASSAWTTGFINLINYPDVYISCPELSNNNFHSPSAFSNAIIKKVPVNAPFAGIISDSYGITDFDYINVSKRNIKRLTFRITDGAGNVIDLNGMNVTLSLLFQNQDMT